MYRRKTISNKVGNKHFLCCTKIPLFKGKEAAKVDFDLIGLDSLDIPMFVISGLVLMSHLTDEAEETEEQKFTEFLANLF